MQQYGHIVSLSVKCNSIHLKSWRIRDQPDVTCYYVLFHFFCAQHVSDINTSIIRNLRLFLLNHHNCYTDTTPTQPHRNSNTHRNKNIRPMWWFNRKIRRFLMMHVLMSETCWAHKKWNKIPSDIKLVSYSSTITMMQGLIHIRFTWNHCGILPFKVLRLH